MSRSVGSTLPDALLARFAHDPAPQVGRAVLLVTVDASGLPHPALLSDGEVLASSPRALRLAVHPASQTAANLRAAGVASLALVEPEGVHYVKLRVREAFPAGPAFACFEADVVDVLEDSPRSDEGHVFVASGIRWGVEGGAGFTQRAGAARAALTRRA